MRRKKSPPRHKNVCKHASRLFLGSICASVFVFLIQCAPSTLKRTNWREHYAIRETVHIRHRILDNGPTLKVYVMIGNGEKDASENPESTYGVSFALFPDYNSKEPLLQDSLLPAAYDTYYDGTHHYIAFDISRSVAEEKAVMRLNIYDVTTKKKRSLPIPLQIKNSPIAYRYAPFKQGAPFPVLNNYLQTGDTVTIASLHTKKQTLYGYYYSHTFDPALPPMTLGYPAKTQKNDYIQADSVFEVSLQEALVLHRPGLYFFQEDTTSTEGVAFFAGNSYYPRLQQAEDLLESLIYISSRKERENIAAAGDKKKVLDNFWLNRGGSPEVARQLIRSYYQRVERANMLFTSYKEGWKTDRGIIYTVFGDPATVFKLEDREIWRYEGSPSIGEIYFTFYLRPSVFIHENYVLERDPNYDRYWYPMVETWRKGIIRN